MSGNGFGTIFRFTTFGESHGIAIGCVIEGVPSNISLCEKDIQKDLDRRKSGNSPVTTARGEPDGAQILSGVFEGKTTGTPIAILIKNKTHESKDYVAIAEKFRPAHADLTYTLKYGNRDYRGGGRASARETAMRVAAGAVAQKVLEHFIQTPFSVKAGLVQVGHSRVRAWDDSQIDQNPLFCPDAEAAQVFEQEIINAQIRGSSVGGVVEVRADGFPAGLGEPVYDRLDADIAKALMSVNAVKGVEIGDGFEAATLYGEENADEMYADENAPHGVGFASNHAGGILGGLSTGQTIVARAAFKPTPSVTIEQKTLDVYGNETTVSTTGRHDPCVAVRGVPVIEAMMKCVLADHLMRYRAQYDF